MKRIRHFLKSFLTLTVIVILYSCNFFQPENNNPSSFKRPERLSYKAIGKIGHGDILLTGWYLVSNNHNNNWLRRVLRGKIDTIYQYDSNFVAKIKKVIASNDTLYINPFPILTVNDLASVEIKYSEHNQCTLNMTFYSDKKEVLRRATMAYLGKKMGFIIDDSVVCTPVVTAEIGGGILALNGKYSKEDMERMKLKLESEMPTTGK